MPIYAFHCRACDKPFESLMRPTDPVVCPGCGAKEQADKLITAPATYEIKGDNSASTRPKGG